MIPASSSRPYIHRASSSCRCVLLAGVFFFQAEDGIRDYKVTGVQTCALPIYGQQQACEIVELERVLAAGGRESGFHSIPNDENRGEGTEEILAHSVEETEVLGDRKSVV